MSEDYGKGRPKEIFRYLFNDGKLSFDYRELPTYSLTRNLRPGPVENGRKRPQLGLKKGIENYRRPTYTVKESKIRLLLLTLLAYQSLNKISNPIRDIVNKEDIEIFAHNGIFTDIMVKSYEVYNIILFRGKMIIANTATRINQNNLYSYIGHKFESIVCRTEDPKGSPHNKLLLEGKYGEWKFKTVVEIDGFKKYHSEKDMTIDDFPLKERLNRFTEMKLCSVYDDAQLERINRIRYKKEFVEFIARYSKSFRHKVKKWLFQSYFGRQDILVIGLRTENMKLICYEEISLQYHLLPYIKEHYKNLYESFVNRESILNDSFNKIYDQIMELRNDEKDVFEVNTRTLEVKKVEEGNGDGDNELFNNMLIEEYRSKIEKNEDILDQCPMINHEQFNELKMKAMTDKMNELTVSNDDEK